MKKVLLVGALIFLSTMAFSQEYKYHPIFIYNFSKYIEWPAEEKDDFVITVVGNDMAFREMLDIVEKKKRSKTGPW